MNFDIPMTFKQAERMVLQAALIHNKWNVCGAARTLQSSRGTVWRKMQEFGIRRPRGRMRSMPAVADGQSSHKEQRVGGAERGVEPITSLPGSPSRATSNRNISLPGTLPSGPKRPIR